MAKGKFEAPKKKTGFVPKNTDSLAAAEKGAEAAGGLKKLWPLLVAAAGVVVIGVGAVLFLTGRENTPGSTPHSSGTEVVTTVAPGLSRAEVEQKAAELDSVLRGTDLVLTLNPESESGEPAGEPITVTLTPNASGAKVDLAKLRADLDGGRGKQGKDVYQLDLADYLVLNDEAIRKLAEETAAEYNSEFAETMVRETYEMVPVEPEPTESESEEPSEPDEPEPTEPEPTEEPGEPTEPTEPAPTEEKAHFLVIRTGVTGRSIEAGALEEALRGAYRKVVSGEDPETALAPALSFELRAPSQVDAEILYKSYCTKPVDATLDEHTYEVIPDKPGYGFNLSEVRKQISEAGEGEELKIRLREIPPELTAEELRNSMYQDVLAEAHTPHSAIPARTNNLILACAEIDGTVVLPGHVFSFNQVVGERTEAKGYLPAIAYVEGGASRPETGGGVCQVASSIYYAVLQADLKTVERAPHMYKVDYVPDGMDAAIYWGQLDYKFENTSPYPIKIQASVSDGQVHITLLGTEWKKYTVELSSEILSITPWEVVQKEVPNDGTHWTGEVLSTPYTGYRIATYKTIRNKAGEAVETVKIATSSYNKRDKVVAVVVIAPQPTEPPVTQPPVVWPTEPPATEPPIVWPTEPPATEPPVTQPPATEPPATEPPATEPPATDPPAPTDPPATDPPAPVVTDPPAPAPTDPPVEPAPDPEPAP